MNFYALFIQLKELYKKKGFLALLFFLINGFNNVIIKKYIRGSFSQKGEDLILEQIFKGKKKGFYIDVGANDPDIFSNTKKFYLRGWRGINIEPNPILLKKFVIKRKRDINLNVGIGKKKYSAVFYEFEMNALSTFSKKDMENKIKLGCKLKKAYKVKIYRLEDIIKKFYKKKIDFITVDTEGMDFEVLRSNDWERFRPKAICVETGDFWLIPQRSKNNKKRFIDRLMIKNGYEVFYSNDLNTIYVETD
ncbi:MAG: FkbM family methyltransferase [Patescibacteria group bacterium]